MATAYKHIEDPKKRIISFAQQRLIEIKDQLSNLENERTMWEELVKMMAICTFCKGQGEIVNVIAQDESRFEKCKGCEGKGYLHD